MSFNGSAYENAKKVLCRGAELLEVMPQTPSSDALTSFKTAAPDITISKGTRQTTLFEFDPTYVNVIENGHLIKELCHAARVVNRGHNLGLAIPLTPLTSVGYEPFLKITLSRYAPYQNHVSATGDELNPIVRLLKSLAVKNLEVSNEDTWVRISGKALSAPDTAAAIKGKKRLCSQTEMYRSAPTYPKL